MSSCAPIGGSDDPDGPNSSAWIFVSGIRGSWSSSVPMTALAVKESLSDDEGPLHPGLSGVMVVFDKDVDFDF